MLMCSGRKKRAVLQIHKNFKSKFWGTLKSESMGATVSLQKRSF